VEQAAGADVERTALASVLAELEGRPVSLFHSLGEPVAEVVRRAEELDAPELAQRGRLVLAGVMLREGRSAEGGRAAHQVLAWAERHGSPYLLARAHRELAIFYRMMGDTAAALTHAVQCVAHLTDDVSPVIRARHLLSLAVALDESGSGDEAGRRFSESLDIATAVGDHELTLYVLNNMAYTAYENSDVPTADSLVDRMREVQRLSRREFGANELDTIARVQMLSRRFGEVEQTLRPMLDDGRATALSTEGDAIAECRLTLAESRRIDQRYDAAQEALDAARRICDERGLAGVRARAREEQAALFAATGRFAQAYEEHRAFHAEAAAMHSSQRDARARALQAVFEATEARRVSEHFREMAHRDPLTGLYNRRYVNERLDALLGEASVRRTPLSLAILDLDHFKQVNDTLSHSTGDTVLQHIAQLLAETATGPGFAARMGGEEFLLVFPGLSGEEASRCCEQLRLRIRTHAWQPITGSLPVTSSIGVTASGDGRDTASALLAQADRNLYAAKRGGRDRVVLDA
jgi:diguanylate cyclase (GGDEF)-like protein